MPTTSSRTKRNTRRIALLATLAVLVARLFALDLGRFLTLDFFKSQQAAIELWRAAHPEVAGLA